MKTIPILVVAGVCMAAVIPALSQDAAPPVTVDPSNHKPAAETPAEASPTATERSELRRRLADLKVQRISAVNRLKEARAAFRSDQVELKIKASHLRSARAENDAARARELEKELKPLRQLVRSRHQSMLEALAEVKRVRDETRETARALGRDADKG
jgi:hypothetical protein